MTPITWYLYGRSGGAKKAVEEIGVKESVSGDIAVISDGADDVAVKSLVAEITPVQSGSGDPSPSNIRPISGRTGLTVATRGKNLFDKTAVTRSAWLSTTTGEVESASSDYVVSDYILVKKGVTVYIPATQSVRRWFYDINKTPTTYLQNSVSQAYTPTDDGYIRVTINKGTVDIDTFQIEFGTSATAYEPYAGQTYPITWESIAGTVYGGTLDVVSGVLTVTHAAVDMGELTWSYSPSLNGQPAFYNVINESKPPASNATKADITCSTYKTVSANELYADSTTTGYISLNASKTLQVRDFRYSTTADFKTAMAGQTLCYELATPQTYQLTGAEVRTILGGNNIYTDAGAVSVEYVADTKLYIDNKIAELQALILEN